MEAVGSGSLSTWTGDTRPKEKGENMVQKSGVAQPKGGGWGGA